MSDDPVDVPALPPADAFRDAIDALLRQWEIDCIHNSPASRDTTGFNHLHTNAIPELRRRLLKGIPE